jgi:uncharacterized protein YceK
MSFRALAPVAVLSTLLLAGCGAIVPMTSSQDANSVACATVTVRFPAEVAGQAKRETNAQATGAWGTPASVLLHCGVAVPGPSTLPCVEVNGIDWLEDDSQKPLYRYTTFGRVPAVEVVVDSNKVSGTTTLVDLAGTLSQIPTTSRCTDLSDTFKN